MSEEDADSGAETVPFLEIIVLEESTFPIGNLMATPRAIAAMDTAGQSIAEFLGRHVRGDFGELDAEDTMSNNRAIEVGCRILSAYSMVDGTKLWIITEADRSATTLLLPDEY